MFGTTLVYTKQVLTNIIFPHLHIELLKMKMKMKKR
jgi:hypothetical protein